MEQDINQPSISMIITGCLLLHFALLYLLGVVDIKPINLFAHYPSKDLLSEEEKSNEQDSQEEQAAHQQEDWVAMDSFGAPIIFQEEIEIPKSPQPQEPSAQQQPTKASEPASQTQESSEPSDQQQITERPQDNIPKTEPQKKAEAPPLPEDMMQEDGSCALQEDAPQMICELSYEKKPTSGHSPTQKPPLSFAQLAQGFMQYSQRQTYIPVVSNKRGFASPEQIKSMNYMQRILQDLVTSYRCVNHTVAGIAQPQPATIIFAINRDGSLHSKNIVRSTGSKLLDDFFLALIDDASLSFPPVPDALAVPFRLPYINFNDPRCFQHVGNWMFQSD